MENQNQNSGKNPGQDINESNPQNYDQQLDGNKEDNNSLASDGPVSQSEGDGGADLNEMDTVPGEGVDDLNLNPDDDERTNVDEEDIKTLNALDQDENETTS